MQNGLLLKYRLMALYIGCGVHDFSIELSRLDVNVMVPSDV